MPTIKLFGYLRDEAQGAKFEVAGRTVGELLNGLCAGNERLRRLIFEEAQPNDHIRILLATCDIELAQGLETPVKPDDVLAIFPPIAGG